MSQLDVVSDKSDIPVPIGRHPDSRQPEKNRQPDKTRQADKTRRSEKSPEKSPDKSPEKTHVEKGPAAKAHTGKTHTDEDHPVTHVVAHPDARADSGIFLGQRFPDLTIATPRLHVRPLTVADTKPVDDVFGDRLTQRWLPFPAEFGPIDGRAWCTNMAAERRAMGSGDHYGIVRRDDDSLIGCMWTKRTDWSARSTEVSFAIAPEARGFGFAAEAIDGLAIELIMRHDFHRIELRVASGNTSSRRVAEKAGFVYEGLLRNAGYVYNGRVDLQMWSLVAADLH